MIQMKGIGKQAQKECIPSASPQHDLDGTHPPPPVPDGERVVPPRVPHLAHQRGAAAVDPTAEGDHQEPPVDLADRHRRPATFRPPVDCDGLVTLRDDRRLLQGHHPLARAPPLRRRLFLLLLLFLFGLLLFDLLLPDLALLLFPLFSLLRLPGLLLLLLLFRLRFLFLLLLLLHRLRNVCKHDVYGYL